MASDLFTFGRFELDPAGRHLRKDGEVVPLSPRAFDLLQLFVARPGRILSKDALIQAAWGGVAVTDNSLEQAISVLRRTLGADEGQTFIETLARRGYRFSGEVRRITRREPAEAIDALLEPHRAWIEGRAALEALERTQIAHARQVFERVLAQVPDLAPAHVGLANAGVMQFEMTRSEAAPDVASLSMAAKHAREACRLDPRYGEAWATLGFVLSRMPQVPADRRTMGDALAASRMAVSLEPDNWRHHLRLAYVGWGEERLRAARRTLALLPGFPLAHWLAATVHVARQAIDEAGHELATGLAPARVDVARRRFTSVALHWLFGLIQLTRGDDVDALDHFQQELTNEQSGQLYAHECCANTWYAIGAVHLRRGAHADAARAFGETLSRVPMHPLAHAVMSAAGLVNANGGTSPAIRRSVVAADAAMGHAVGRVVAGDVTAAAAVIDVALENAPEGSALWTLPVDPVLRALGDPRWATALARLRNRAA